MIECWDGSQLIYRWCVLEARLMSVVPYLSLSMWPSRLYFHKICCKLGSAVRMLLQSSFVSICHLLVLLSLPDSVWWTQSQHQQITCLDGLPPVCKNPHFLLLKVLFDWLGNWLYREGVHATRQVVVLVGNPPCLKIVKSLLYVATSLKMCLSCAKKRRFLYLLDQHTAPLARSSSFLLPKNFPISSIFVSTMTDRWVGIW